MCQANYSPGDCQFYEEVCYFQYFADYILDTKKNSQYLNELTGLDNHIFIYCIVVISRALLNNYE